MPYDIAMIPELQQPERPEHSLLGASGAERWMNCAGSVALLKALELPETDEPDYRREGTAGHEAAAHCLTNGLDTWEIVGQVFNDTEITEPMAQAIQTYLDAVRPSMEAAVKSYIEFPVSSPVHELFYGTLDFGAIIPPGVLDEFPKGLLDITDLKMGEGIMVEVDDNPQLKYYAFGFIDGVERSGYIQGFAEDFPVRLRIVQPRGYLEPIRDFMTTWGEIREWVNDTLVPAMHRTEIDNDLDAGPWCRFCPAKLVCPLLTSLYRAAATYNPKEIINISDESIGRSYQYLQGVEFYVKALKDDVFRRLNNGKKVPGAMLTPKKANRVFKATAHALAEKEFGAEAFTTPVLKSPPQIEALGAAGKAFVKQWSYKPDTGLTVCLESDKSKPRVDVRPLTETFAAIVEALPE